jgi:MarR family transcriptional regulator, lower aerobic nicotinate degradation pathway regulator
MVAERELVAQLAELALLIERAHEQSARRHDLSPTLARLLALLNGRAPTMNELANLLGLDKSSTSGLVDRAQRRGLVRRVPSQLDRRSVRVRVTKQGSELNETLSNSFAKDVAAVFEPLTDADRQTLAASLSAILSAR